MLPWLICGGLAAIVIALLVKLWLLRRSLDEMLDQLEERLASLPSTQDICQAQERVRNAEEKLGGVNAMLAGAIEDLHFVMAGGDTCKVCARKCAFGTGDCKPVWRGEEACNELEK